MRSAANIIAQTFEFGQQAASGNQSDSAPTTPRPPGTAQPAQPIDPRTTAQMIGPVRHTVPRRPAKVAAIDIDTLLVRHRDGLTLRQLAVEFGTHRTTISDLLRSVGVETNRFVVPRATVDQIIRMYRDGASCITIGKQIGRTKSTVRGILVRNGVQMRDSHGRVRVVA